jgi:hypothetical protein
MNRTPAEWAAYWAAIKNTLPGGEAFHGEYWWLNRIGSAGNPTGVTASKTTAGNATFGAVLEHDSQIRQGERCTVEIIATNRTPDIGFTGNNVIEVGGFRDTVTCPICGLSGRIQGGSWVSV